MPSTTRLPSLYMSMQSSAHPAGTHGRVSEDAVERMAAAAARGSRRRRAWEELAGLLREDGLAGAGGAGQTDDDHGVGVSRLRREFGSGKSVRHDAATLGAATAVEQSPRGSGRYPRTRLEHLDGAEAQEEPFVERERIGYGLNLQDATREHRDSGNSARQNQLCIIDHVKKT